MRTSIRLVKGFSDSWARGAAAQGPAATAISSATPRQGVMLILRMGDPPGTVVRAPLHSTGCCIPRGLSCSSRSRVAPRLPIPPDRRPRRALPHRRLRPATRASSARYTGVFGPLTRAYSARHTGVFGPPHGRLRPASARHTGVFGPPHGRLRPVFGPPHGRLRPATRASSARRRPRRSRCNAGFRRGPRCRPACRRGRELRSGDRVTATRAAPAQSTRSPCRPSLRSR